MRKLFQITRVLVLIISFVPFQASALLTLTLEESISRALGNNDSLRASFSDVEMHKQDTKKSFSEFFPKLSSSARYTRFDRPQTFTVEKNAFSPGIPPVDTDLPTEDEDIYAFTLSIKQPIFTGGNLINTYKSSIMMEKASSMNSEKVRDEVILKVKSAYFDVLKTLRIKEAQEGALRQKQEHLRVLEERQKEGISTKEEFLLAKADTTQQELELLKTDNNLKIRKTRLKNLIGLDSDTEISLVDKLEIKKLLIGLIESKDIVLKNSRELFELDYKKKSAARGIEIAKSSFYPEASVKGSYTRQKETPLSNPDLWTVMVMLDWDVFEWGKTRAEVRRSSANLEKINSEYNSLKKQIMLDAEDRWFAVNEAEKTVEVTKEKFTHAEERYKNASLKYREKLIKTAELLEAETYLIKSRNDYYNSIYDLNIAVAELEFSLSSNISKFTEVGNIKQNRIEIIETDKHLAWLDDEGDATTQKQEEELSAETHNQNKKIQKTGNETNSHVQAIKQKNIVKPDPAGLNTSPDKHKIFAVQVGAFKSADIANTIVEQLKVSFPETYIIRVNNFNKVRIPGIKTKHEGTLILQEIQRKLKLEPLLIVSQSRPVINE